MHHGQGLFDTVASVDGLARGYARVARNRGGPGVDRVTVEQFGRCLDDNLHRLAADLRSGKYKPLPLARACITKVGGGKRQLAIPAVRDRVAQTAAAQVLTPLLEPVFEPCSYGYRPGRSVQMAVRRIVDYRRSGCEWVVDADIKAYFDRVDHDLLLETLRDHVLEERLMALIELWINARVRGSASTSCRGRGVPQGAPLSPLVANLYLDRMDKAMLAKGWKLVRFADDFLVVCGTRSEAERGLRVIRGLLCELKLELNPRKTRLANFQVGFRFLGHRFVGTTVSNFANGSTPARSTAGDVTRGSPRRSADVATDNGNDKPVATCPGNARVGCSAPAKGGKRRRADRDSNPEAADKATRVAQYDPLLRSLYLMEQGSVLSKRDERFLVTNQGVRLREIPAIKVDQILVFGNIQLSTPALRLCISRHIYVALLTRHGRLQGGLENSGSGKVLLQRDQFRRVDDGEFRLVVSRQLVMGKIAGARLLLRRYRRSRQTRQLERVLQVLGHKRDRAASARSIEELRGVEGAAAASYFQAMRRLLHPALGFERRERRPPADPVNAALSYCYTLVFQNLHALICAEGLNPHVGFMHPVRADHPALVSDLMEEFRAPVADAVVWPLFLKGVLSRSDFDRPGNEGVPCRMPTDVRKRITHAFEAKMNSSIANPRTGNPSDYRRLMAYQVRTMARAIRGDAEYVALGLK